MISDLVSQVLAAVLAAVVLSWRPMRRWRAIDRNIRLMRRAMGRRDRIWRSILRRFKRRLDEHAGLHAEHVARFEEIEQRLPGQELA